MINTATDITLSGPDERAIYVTRVHIFSLYFHVDLVCLGPASFLNQFPSHMLTTVKLTPV